MAAKDLGTKYTCFKCGAKFYDLKRPEPICPKCGADQREATASRPPERERKRAARVAVEEPEVEQELAEEEEEGLGAEEEGEEEEGETSEEDEDL